MGLQYRDIETGETVYANSAARAYELFQNGDYKGTMEKLYEETQTLKMPLRERITLKVLELKEACTNSIYAGFASNSTDHVFGFNEYDQANFGQQFTVVVAGDPSNITWKTKDAGPVEFTVAQFKEVLNEAKNHKESKQRKYWEYEQRVLAAKDEEELKDIKWQD